MLVARTSRRVSTQAVSFNVNTRLLSNIPQSSGGNLITPAQPFRPKTRSWFYSAMGLVAVFSICIGFGRTYAVPMARGTFTGPLILHVHGALALAWVLLFVAQPLLIRRGAFYAHRWLGCVGLPLALAVAGTMVPAGLYATIR